jgi:hypothetical protein
MRNKEDEQEMNKIDVLNSLEVLDYDANGGELEYLIVPNTEENRVKLLEIGTPSDELQDAITDDGEGIDISMICFEYGGAKWFKPKSGFTGYVPEDAPEWAK